MGTIIFYISNNYNNLMKRNKPRRCYKYSNIMTPKISPFHSKIETCSEFQNSKYKVR